MLPGWVVKKNRNLGVEQEGRRAAPGKRDVSGMNRSVTYLPPKTFFGAGISTLFLFMWNRLPAVHRARLSPLLDKSTYDG